MEENNYNIGIREDATEVYKSGIAHIVIPKDIDRSKYIAECFRTATVSIYSEFNGFCNRVPIDRFSINFIEFPDTSNELGSAVSFKCDPVIGKHIVDGIFFKKDDLSDLVEHQFKFKRKLNGNMVEIVGSPKGKYIGLNVTADEEGEVFINVKSKDKSGKVSINVEGECNITSLTDTTIRQHGKLTFQTIDPDKEDQATVEEHTPNGRHIISDTEKLSTQSLVINDGKENFVLGQKLKGFLDDLITEIGNITTTTSFGQMPILNKEQVLSYKEKTKDILSAIGFIDK